MKTHSYRENTVALFKLLKHHAPEGIFSDGQCQVVFDYKDFHIIAVLDVLVAASQNKSDEIISVEFKQIDSAFQPRKHDKLMFQNKAIDRLYILRTMLYFTDYIPFSSEAEAVNGETNPILADLMKESPGRYEEVVCHPKSTEAESVNKEFANLVEAGIMLEIDRQLLICFAWCNGFCIVGDIISLDEIEKEIAPFYEFIEI